ncbi:MAG: ABC transporter ATP-binding protein/permease [Anaerolineae bacterium]
MTLAVEVHDLTKRFAGTRLTVPRLWSRHADDRQRTEDQDTLAVDRVSLGVHRGEIFGLMGPNGAGKTTLVKMLATLILPTSGSAIVNGYPLTCPDEIKASIGLMTCNERSFYPRLSCRENLRFYGGLSQLSSTQVEAKITWLSEMLELNDFLDKRYDRCSTGMKHRLALARALLNDASLLFLDEPTVSLDPVAAHQFRERLYSLVQQEARTVFMVTHNLDEAEVLCDRVAVMLQGRLWPVGSPERLRALLTSETRCNLRVRGYTPSLADQLRDVEAVVGLTEHGTSGGITHLEIQLENRKRALPGVVATVEAGGAELEGLDLATPSWDQVAERLTIESPEPSRPAVSAASTLTTTPRTTVASQVSDGGDVNMATSEIRPGLGVHGADSSPASKGAFGTWLARLALPRLSLRSRLEELARTLPLFFKRDLRTQLSYRLSFLLQLIGILFSIASYYFVGQVFGMAASPYLQAYGGDYFSFVLIGIAFVGYQGVALYGFSSVIQSAQSAGTLEAMLTTPTRLSAILLGSSVWDFAFTSLRVVLYLVAGAVLFGAQFGEANLLAALIILVLTVTSLGAIGILSASFIMAFKRGNPINFLIGGVSVLLGGVYYPVEVLPRWLQTLARFYPLTTSLQGMRRALLSGAPPTALMGEIGVLILFSVVLLPLGLLAFSYAVRQAKRDGSLTQF